MKINLIFFISEFNLGGAGNSLFKLCRNLPKDKYRISVICLNKCYYKNLLVKNKVKVFEIKSSRTLFAMNKIKKIAKSLINKNYKNIFVSNIYYSNILSILFLRVLPMKIVLIERTPYEELSIYYNILDFLKKNIIKFLIRTTFWKADICVSNSNYISKKYNKKYKLKFKTIFPPSFQGKIFNTKKKFKNKVCFGTICRLGKEKNLYNLIKLLSKFKGKFYFEIIGDGPEKNKLINLKKQLNLDGEVKLIGEISPNKINKYFKNFDYYINSSDFEGFPNSVVEALSHRTPVIASQSHGGINEIITNKEFGYIYKNENELETIIRKIIKNKYIYKINSRKIYKHLIKFSEKNNLKNYNFLFQKIK
tara:strand:+ start:483 stop:1574 length:1092 start_codon:yes stop_codon:yes gene_type:complete